MKITITPCKNGQAMSLSFPVTDNEFNKIKAHFLIPRYVSNDNCAVMILPIEIWRFIKSLCLAPICNADSFLLTAINENW